MSILETINIEEKKLLSDYLKKRYDKNHEKKGLNIVFDITKYCNLSCVGCCVNAKLINKENYEIYSKNDLSEFQVKEIITKISNYYLEIDTEDVYINFGGGEPFIRKDFVEILRFTRKKFPKGKIAVDTNGTVFSEDTINSAFEYLDVIGFSIDGLEVSHDKWRRPPSAEEGFKKTISQVQHLLRKNNVNKKIEITSVATNDNIKELPSLARYLHSIGVENFSVHRSMPVGRMTGKPFSIPTARDYLDLFINLIKVSVDTGLSIHMHHSIESIYASLLIGKNTYHDKKVNSNQYSSIAINHKGDVFLDPWVTDPPWDKLSIGSLISMYELTNLVSEDNSKYRDLLAFYDKKLRCNGCMENCAGGSRVAAAYESLHIEKSWNRTNILSHLTNIDPACLLNEG